MGTLGDGTGMSTLGAGTTGIRGGVEGSEGQGAGGARARPRMEATFARALRMGGPKERGVHREAMGWRVAGD